LRVTVQTNVAGTVTLKANGIDAVPDDRQIWLVDPALDLSQNLRANPRYQFPASGTKSTRTVRILVGSPAAVQEVLGHKSPRPERVRLYPSAPNPVRGQATLRYAVPSRTRVTLELYDLLGRRVATLVEGRAVSAGMHAHVWTPGSQGGRISSGTYLLRLRAGDKTRTRRVVIVQ
jgi:hypothetical protein